MVPPTIDMSGLYGAGPAAGGHGGMKMSPAVSPGPGGFDPSAAAGGMMPGMQYYPYPGPMQGAPGGMYGGPEMYNYHHDWQAAAAYGQMQGPPGAMAYPRYAPQAMPLPQMGRPGGYDTGRKEPSVSMADQVKRQLAEAATGGGSAPPGGPSPAPLS